MKKTLHIQVKNKIATYKQRGGAVVCGNTDYQIAFAFDSEWDAYPRKTARFIWNGQHLDQPFTGDVCPMPKVYDTTSCLVGVYVDDFETTTPAKIDCIKSILCVKSEKHNESDKVYADDAKESADRAANEADRAEDAADRAEEAAKDLTTDYLPLAGGDLTGTLGIKQGGVGVQLGTSGNICATDTHNGGGTTRTILGAGIHWATDAATEDEMTIGHPVFHLALRGSRKRPTYCEAANKANNTELALLKDVYLASTGDTTDRLAEIQTLLDTNGYVKLGKGEFYLSGQLKIGNGATLDGCGKATVIKQTPDSTQPSMVWLKSEGTIRNVCLQGEWTTTPTNETEKSSTRIGIVITNGTNNAIIDGCWIWGWTGQGILASNNSTATRSFLMSNCDICFNNIGLKTVESEYACITNCSFRNNITGVLNNGGNNKFVSCGFDMNYDGFVINEGYNNGHGSCNGCTFNHNTHYAVNMAYTELGFVFSGCNFAEGTIRNTKSKGIMFSGCRFGNWLKYNNYTTNPTLFSGCIFSHSPKTESAEWLDSYGGYKFTGCYNYNTGESVDNIPVAPSEQWTFTVEDANGDITTETREVLLND